MSVSDLGDSGIGRCMDQTWALKKIEKVEREGIQKLKKKGKGRKMEDHFLATLEMHWDWYGKGIYKSKFQSIMGFGPKSMTVGKGYRLAAICVVGLSN